MGIVDDVIRINRERPRKNDRTDIYTPEPNEIFKGLLDCVSYASARFNVENIGELTREQYSHACAEYITALIQYSTEFFNFVNHIEK